MAGVLDQLGKQIYAGFKGRLLKGTLKRTQAAQGSGLDALGDPLAPEALTWPCQGFTDRYSDIYRAQAGIPEGDVKANIFAASLPAGVRPLKDDQVQFRGVWYQLRSADTDPAIALWVCQAFQTTPST